MMEGNKDEADKCFELAQKAFNGGDRAKAERFLVKAQKLYPTQKAKDLLELLSKLGETGSTRRTAEDSPYKRASASSRQNADADKENSEKSCGKDYTQEQVAAVKKIKSSKDYYEILGVSKESTDTDLKKAYRKLALQFHPDKNKAPGAGEAFKAIGNAFAILSDVEKRKQYDMYGADVVNNGSSSYSRSRSHYSEYSNGYSRGFESDMTAEELFNMFFGGGFPSSSVYATNRNRRTRYYYSSTSSGGSGTQSEGGGHQEGTNVSATLQLLPILFFIAITLLSTFFVSDPVFSLNRTQKYNVKRLTTELEVPYFVKESFASDFQGNLKRLESGIEEEYVSTMRGECYKQRNYKEHMVWRAKNFGDEQSLNQAKDITLPSCEALQNLRQKTRYA